MKHLNALFLLLLPPLLAKTQDGVWTSYFAVSNTVYTIAIDAEGNKWFGTESGVSKFDGTNYTRYHMANSGITGNLVWAIAIDRQGNKWFGTDNGVSKFDGKNWTTYTTKNSGLATNSIRSMAIDQEDNKWFGAFEKWVVSKFDGVNWTTY